MNKNTGIAVAIGIAIIAGVLLFQVSSTMWEQVSVEEYYEKGGKVPGVVYPDNPQLLGPLQINKDKYLLGENVFLVLKNLKSSDNGTVLIITPNGKIYDEWGFNGMERESQKKYFKPQLLKAKNLCDKEQLIGQWTIMFKGYEMSKLHFEIVDQTLPDMEWQYVECEISYEINITKPMP
tara:strand:+ start:785 stop:1321 length:537 start_codon:yes stop_codon:yes gene_type:complete